jgi:hypothetical protein
VVILSDFEIPQMTLNFSSDASSERDVNISTSHLFSGMKTNFNVSPQSKALINLNIRTGDIFSNNKVTIRR